MVFDIKSVKFFLLNLIELTVIKDYLQMIMGAYVMCLIYIILLTQWSNDLLY